MHAGTSEFENGVRAEVWGGSRVEMLTNILLSVQKRKKERKKNTGKFALKYKDSFINVC